MDACVHAPLQLDVEAVSEGFEEYKGKCQPVFLLYKVCVLKLCTRLLKLRGCNKKYVICECVNMQLNNSKNITAWERARAFNN